MKAFSSVAVVWAVFTAFVVCLCVGAIDRIEAQRFDRQTRQTVLDRLNTVRVAIEGDLKTRTAVARQVAVLANSPSDRPTDAFTNFAETLIETDAALTHVVWQPPDGLLWVYPPTTNLRLPPPQGDNQQRPISVVSSDRPQVWVSATPPTPSNGNSGTAVLAMDLQQAIAEMDLQERTPDLTFSIRTAQPANGSRLVLFGDNDLFSQRPVTGDISFAGGKWQIAGRPTGGWEAASPLQFWIRGLGAMVAAIAAGGAYALMRERQQRQRAVVRATAELRHREAQYRTFVERSSVFLVQLDLEGRVVFANPHTQHVFGYAASELAHRAFADRLAAPQFEKLLRQVQHDPERTAAGEVLCQRRNGEMLWVEWHLTGVLGDNGQLVGAMVVGTDISDRQAAEVARRQSEMQLRGLLSSMTDMIVVFDGDGRYLDVAPTASQILPCCDRHLVGRTVREVLPEDRAETVVQQVQAVLAHHQPQIFELDIPKADAESICLSVKVSPLTADSVVMVARDISDRRRMEEELRRAKIDLEQRVRERAGEIYTANKRLQQEVVERMQIEEALRHSEVREREKAQQLERALLELKRTQAQLVQTEKMSSLGQLAAGMAHEINNPVNFIYGNLTPLRDYAGDLLELIRRYASEYPEPTPLVTEWMEEIDLSFIQDDFFRVVNSMQVGAERIRKIIASLKNFSRLDEVGMKSVDFHEGIDSTLLVLQSRFHGHGKRVDIEIIRDYGDLPPVRCYANQINQVLTNLIENSIDALEDAIAKSQIDRPQVKICTRVVNETEIIVVVEDNGIGIPAEVQSQIFNPFFTTKPVGKGTGLGLSIAYQIIHDTHGGCLLCQSQPGCTRFEIRLPLG